MELFGGMPDAVKFIIVFLVILCILVPLLWRRFGVGSLSASAQRGRQARLAVIDTASVDVRRKLVLIKRDNVEHLLMIGGPADIVVESGIVRTPAAAREPRPIPDARTEAARQAAAEASDWTLPLEPMARPVRTVDLDAALPEPAARTAREAMVDSMRAVRSVAAAQRGLPPDLDSPPEEIAAPALTPLPSPVEVNHRPTPESRRAPEPQWSQPAPEPVPPSDDAPPEPKRERPAPPPRPVTAAPPPPPRPVQPVPAAAAANAPRQVQPLPTAAASAAPVPPSPSPMSSDESDFAEMTQRLEAALRRPNPAKAEAPPVRPPRRSESPAGRKPTAVDAAGSAKVSVKSPDSPPPDLKVLPGKGKNESAMESLEDEMARMLGRPGKS
jgi:hypothetical protein